MRPVNFELASFWENLKIDVLIIFYKLPKQLTKWGIPETIMFWRITTTLPKIEI